MSTRREDPRGAREPALERIVPEELARGSALDRTILEVHLDRYRWAGAAVAGRTTLDIACGVGYGSDLLARAGAESVVGVDLSADAIDHARRSYGGGATRFVQGDLFEFTSERSFDVIVSFETLEHLVEPVSAMNHLRSLLRPGGQLIASVPTTFSTDFNPFHLHDFTEHGFLSMVERSGFRVQRILRQIHGFSPLAVLKARGNPEERLGNGPRLAEHYRRRPGDLARRIGSLLRYGFTNRYVVVQAACDEGAGAPRPVRVDLEVRRY